LALRGEKQKHLFSQTCVTIKHTSTSLAFSHKRIRATRCLSRIRETGRERERERVRVKEREIVREWKREKRQRKRHRERQRE